MVLSKINGNLDDIWRLLDEGVDVNEADPFVSRTGDAIVPRERSFSLKIFLGGTYMIEVCLVECFLVAQSS